MATNRQAWAAEERAEYEDLLGAVVASGTDTHVRLDLFEKLLNGAIQAQRTWAEDVQRTAQRAGFAKEIKGYQDRTRAMVGYQGQVLNLPSIQSAKVRTSTGQIAYQRELIELWTWDQVLEKRAEAIRTRRIHTDKIAHYDKLLALRDLCPESKTPEEAATILGISLVGWLLADDDESEAA